jgi:hypothetical protein
MILLPTHAILQLPTWGHDVWRIDRCSRPLSNYQWAGQVIIWNQWDKNVAYVLSHIHGATSDLVYHFVGGSECPPSFRIYYSLPGLQNSQTVETGLPVGAVTAVTMTNRTKPCKIYQHFKLFLKFIWIWRGYRGFFLPCLTARFCKPYFCAGKFLFTPVLQSFSVPGYK